MRHLSAALVVDARMLYRTGYVYATLAMFALLLILVLQLSRFEFSNFADIVTAIILLDEVIGPVLLIGLLILDERGEGSMASLAVTPMKRWTYLAAKTIAVGLICAAQMLLLVLISYEGSFAVIPLIAGVFGAACMATLFGVAVVAPFDTLYRFVLPMIGAIFFLSLPGYAGLFGWTHSVLAVHPMSPPLTLMEAAFVHMSPARLVFGYGGTLMWLGVAGLLARASYQHMQTRAVGG